MRKKYIFGKKLYISILTSILVLLTTVATTFAWVGVFANSTFDTFDVKIKSSRLEEYGIEISLTGEPGTFSDSISSSKIKKEILKNWGYSDDILSSVDVDNLFSTLKMVQCTTLPNVSSGDIVSLNPFTDIEGNITTNYYKFDIYVSAKSFYEGTHSDFKLDVFLDEGLIKGNYNSRMLVNPFSYPSSFVSPLIGEKLPDGIEAITGYTEIKRARINSKNAVRVAFEKYEVVQKGHPEQYTTSSTPKSTIIYTGDDYNYPVYDSNNNTYDFGSILDDDLNLAIGYYNSTEYLYSVAGIKTVSVSDSNASIYAGDIFTIRGVEGTNPDKLFNSTTNHLIDSTNANEQIGIHEMMKMTVYFWFEGWDADCFPAISNSPISLTVSLSINNENQF